MIKLLLILYLLLSFLNYDNMNSNLEVIRDISSPQQVTWISEEELLLVKAEDIFKYNIYNRSLKKIGERTPNTFVSLNHKGEIIFCEFEHFIIESPDEFSTILRVRDDKGDLRKEIKVFETIRPIWMDEQKIIAVTALDFLEEHFYRIDIETEYKEEVPSPFKQYSLDIPIYIDVRRVFVRNEELFVIEDMRGNLILYNNFATTKRIIPTLTAIFKPVPIRNPKNDAKPNLILWFKSFFSNIYSKSVAPKNEPRNTPTTLPITPPTTEPSTDPITPYLDPPAFLAPNAPAISSAKVESIEMIRRITRVSGVIT